MSRGSREERPARVDPRHRGSRGWRWGVGGLAVLAAVSAGLRVWTEPNIGSDSLLYLIPVHNLLAGNGYSYMGETQLLMPPGFGVLAYVVFLVVRDIELSGMLVSAISAVLTIPIVFSIVARIAGDRAGWVGAFLVTCWPTMVKYAHVNYSDLAFALFLVLTARLYLAAWLGEASLPGHVLLGVGLGFNCLIRPEGALVAVLALGSLAVRVWRRARELDPDALRGRAQPLSRVCLAALMTVIVVFPYAWFLHRETGHWTLSTKLGVNLVVGESVVDGEDALEQKLAESANLERTGLFVYIGSQGSRMILRVWRNLLMEVGQLVKITLHGLLLLVLIGGFSVRRLGGARACMVAARAWGVPFSVTFVVFMSPLPVYLLFFILDRFLLPYAVLALSAIAVVVGAWLNECERDRPLSRAAAAVPLTAGVLVAMSAVLLPLPSPWPSLPAEWARAHGHRGLRAAGLWLARSGARIEEITVWAPGKGDVVLFYASGKAAPRGHQRKVLSTMSVRDIVDGMDTRAPAYLVVDRYYGPGKPELWRLWTDAALAEREGLRVVFEADDRSVKIFERHQRRAESEPVSIRRGS